MARGYKTGGRKKGSLNKVTRAFKEAVAEAGETPLEYMVRVMRDKQAEPQRRDAMAKASAPYLHPQLSSVEQRTELEITNDAAIPRPETYEDFLKYVAASKRPTNGSDPDSKVH